MVDPGARHLDAFVPQQAQPEAQVHVFTVAEEILIEAAGFQKQVAAVKGGGGAGCEHLPLGRKAVHGGAMMPAPDEPAGMVDITGTVQISDVGGVELGRSEHRRGPASGLRPKPGPEQPFGPSGGDPLPAITAGGHSQMTGGPAEITPPVLCISSPGHCSSPSG